MQGANIMNIRLEFLDPCGFVLHAAEFGITYDVARPLEGKGEVRVALPCGPNEDPRAPFSVRVVHQ